MEFNRNIPDKVVDYFGVPLSTRLGSYRDRPEPGSFGSSDLAEMILNLLQSGNREQQIQALEAILYAATLRDQLMALIQASHIGGEVTLRPEAVFEEAETCPSCQNHPLLHTINVINVKRCFGCGFSEA